MKSAVFFVWNAIAREELFDAFFSDGYDAVSFGECASHRIAHTLELLEHAQHLQHTAVTGSCLKAHIVN